MEYDPIREFQRYKNHYLAKRGGVAGTNEPVLRTKLVPKTTWKEVVEFGAAFMAAAERGGHVRTTSYRRALTEWENTFPAKKLVATEGVQGLAKLYDKITSGEVYPWNEEFWGYGARYAIARSAVGGLPSKLSLAAESIEEAVKELPSTVVGVAASAIPSLNLGSGLGRTFEMLKWATFLGLGGWLFIKLYRRRKGG